MKIVRVEEVEQRGGILLVDLGELRKVLWSFFERKELPSTRTEVDRNIRLITGQSFRVLEHFDKVTNTRLRIEIIGGEKKLYFLRIKNYDHFNIEAEKELAQKISKPLSIISFLVRVETELEDGVFIFDFREILNRLKIALPDLDITADRLSTEVMISYDPYSGRAKPFRFYQSGDIQVSLTFGQEIMRRECKDTWRLDSERPVIRGIFIPTTDETSPSFQIIIEKVSDGVLPLVSKEDMARELANKIVMAMQ